MISEGQNGIACLDILTKCINGVSKLYDFNMFAAQLKNLL